jgi:hypothetical protein
LQTIIAIICLSVFLFSAPITVAFDQDIVDCCLKPCSCLPEEKRKPSCSKQTIAECKRMGGEVVSDCVMCQ